MPAVTVRVVQWQVMTQSMMMRYLCVVDYDIGDMIWNQMVQTFPTLIFGWTHEMAVWFPQNFVYTVEVVEE